jgi:hypothetical protein
MKRKIIMLASAGIILLIVMQFIPYGKNHTNPGNSIEPVWNNSTTRSTFMRVCGNCHSNETSWPWYSNIAPVSWLVWNDVAKGRRNLNISEWGKQEINKGAFAADELKDGYMPPASYSAIHPEAALSDTEKLEFIKGLKSTFKNTNK